MFSTGPAGRHARRREDDAAAAVSDRRLRSAANLRPDFHLTVSLLSNSNLNQLSQMFINFRKFYLIIIIDSIRFREIPIIVIREILRFVRFCGSLGQLPRRGLWLPRRRPSPNFAAKRAAQRSRVKTLS